MNPQDSLFGQYITKVLKNIPLLRRFYVSHAKFLNYAFVCGIIGVAVNYVVYHLAVTLIWEPIAFYMGVGIAGFSNYFFSIGSGGRIFGLSKEENKK